MKKNNGSKRSPKNEPVPFSCPAAFMNVGEPFISIDWQYMRGDQGHPQFWIVDSEYGDDPATTEQYDPWRSQATITGSLGVYPDNVFTADAGQMQLHLTRGQEKYQDYHYSGDRLIVKAGAGDMPNKGWRKILLSSCYSGDYFYHQFNHGTLFFTTEDAGASITSREFVKAIIDDKDDDGVLVELNKTENIHDYHVFP